MEAVNDTKHAMAGRPRRRIYDVLAVSSTVHKANADYLAGILRYASGRQDWRLWLFNPLADYSYGNVLPARRASGVIANDRIAKVAADICRVSGIRVPQEIAILGVDDEEMVCNFTSPTLSSVRPAFEAGGYMAA